MERWAAALTDAFESQVLPVVSGADVFIDSSMAEILHWTESAPELLLRAKAASVRRFSSFELASADRAVFLLADPLTDDSAVVLRDLLGGRKRRKVVVFVAVSAQAVALSVNSHNPEEPGSLRSRWTARVKEWASGCPVDVRQLALVCASVLPRLWLLPPPSFVTRDNGGSRDWITVDRLNSLLDILKVREEIFAVGKAANSLAIDLVNYGPARNRRKMSYPHASLVLLERGLDLVSACSSQTDSPLDSIFRRLPAFSRDVQSDVAVDLRPLATATDLSLLPAGCLADADRKLLLEAAGWRQKESLVELLKRVLSASAEEGLEGGLERVPARISPSMLVQAAAAFKASPAAMGRHSGLLQVALAAAAAGGGPSAERTRAEKAVVANAGEGEEQEAGLVEVLRRETEEGAQRVYTFEEAVGFVVYVLSVMGPEHEVGEKSWAAITVSLTQLLCEEIHTRQQMEEEEQSTPLMDMIFAGKTPDIDAAPEAARRLMRRLRAVQRGREELKKWRCVVDTTVVPRYQPLVSTVAAHCCGTDRSPADLSYLSTGLKDLFKSGLSYFVQTKSHHPADSEGLLLLVVLGPVTWAEFRAVAEVADSAAPQLQLALVCCGGISRGADSLSRLLTAL